MLFASARDSRVWSRASMAQPNGMGADVCARSSVAGMAQKHTQERPFSEEGLVFTANVPLYFALGFIPLSGRHRLDLTLLTVAFQQQ